MLEYVSRNVDTSNSKLSKDIVVSNSQLDPLQDISMFIYKASICAYYKNAATIIKVVMIKYNLNSWFGVSFFYILKRLRDSRLRTPSIHEGNEQNRK